jgi:hypothetical protein
METLVSILVIPRQIPLESYQSLAGLPVSSLPDGVGLSWFRLSVHRLSSLFPLNIAA